MTLVPRIEFDPLWPQSLDEAFVRAGSHRIAACNWPEAFDYAPQTAFSIFHDGERLYIRYRVEEICTMALVDRDNGRVWTDSCVEFFIAPDGEGYYNFEANAIGRLLAAWRRSRNEGIVFADGGTLSSIVRVPSLGNEPFGERKGPVAWSLTLTIPATALFRHALGSWSGLRAGMNLYKCGDDLSRPHYLSWRPVRCAQPDFHRPEFFEDTFFE